MDDTIKNGHFSIVKHLPRPEAATPDHSRVAAALLSSVFSGKVAARVHDMLENVDDQVTAAAPKNIYRRRTEARL